MQRTPARLNGTLGDVINLEAIPAEVLATVASAALALVVASLAHLSFDKSKPNWAVRVWLLLIKANPPLNSRRYVESRQAFGRREQFLATFGICFFAFVAVSLIALAP